MQIERNVLVEELALRKVIRKAIKIVKEKKNKAMKEEEVFRGIVRKLIKELKAKNQPNWRSYGLNQLDQDLFRSGFLEEIEKGYKKLTTTKAMRDSYKSHIMYHLKKFIDDELAKEAEMGEPSSIEESVELIELVQEQEEETEESPIKVSIGSQPSLLGTQEEETEEDEEFQQYAIPGNDASGLSEAIKVLNKVKGKLLGVWGTLKYSRVDRDDFYQTLFGHDESSDPERQKGQLERYFEEWETDLQGFLSDVENGTDTGSPDDLVMRKGT